MVSHVVVNVVADGDVTTGDTSAPSVTDNPNSRRNEPGSDHRPVVADIRF